MANVYAAAATTVIAGFIPAPSTSQTAAAAPAAPLILRERAKYSLTAKGSRSLMPSRAAVQLLGPSTGGACRDDVAVDGADDIQLRRPSGFYRRRHVHFDLPDNIPLVGGRRSCLAAAGLLLAMGLSLTGGTPVVRGAVLEADDDVELLEKVKEDRKKRLERQGVISSSGRERGYLQELVYKLSKVGQAIDNDDLSAAGGILGSDASADWVKNVNGAFAKLSSPSPEEETEVDTFNASLVSLIGSVAKKDVESSKLAFVTSASALEKWVTLTGLAGELTGL